MTISRGQMNRHLRMGGGIMDIVPRDKALLGGIKRAVKKVTGGVKDIVHMHGSAIKKVMGMLLFLKTLFAN